MSLANSARQPSPVAARIDTLEAEINVTAPNGALSSPERLLAALRAELLPVLSTVLEAPPFATADIRLARLDIDLGTWPDDPSWPEVRRRFAHDLRAALTPYLRAQNDQTSDSSSVQPLNQTQKQTQQRARAHRFLAGLAPLPSTDQLAALFTASAASHENASANDAQTADLDTRNRPAVSTLTAHNIEALLTALDAAPAQADALARAMSAAGLGAAPDLRAILVQLSQSPTALDHLIAALSDGPLRTALTTQKAFAPLIGAPAPRQWAGVLALLTQKKSGAEILVSDAAQRAVTQLTPALQDAIKALRISRSEGSFSASASQPRKAAAVLRHISGLPRARQAPALLQHVALYPDHLRALQAPDLASLRALCDPTVQTALEDAPGITLRANALRDLQRMVHETNASAPTTSAEWRAVATRIAPDLMFDIAAGQSASFDVTAAETALREALLLDPDTNARAAEIAARVSALWALSQSAQSLDVLAPPSPTPPVQPLDASTKQTPSPDRQTLGATEKLTQNSPNHSHGVSASRIQRQGAHLRKSQEPRSPSSAKRLIDASAPQTRTPPEGHREAFDAQASRPPQAPLDTSEPQAQTPPASGQKDTPDTNSDDSSRQAADAPSTGTSDATPKVHRENRLRVGAPSTEAETADGPFTKESTPHNQSPDAQMHKDGSWPVSSANVIRQTFDLTPEDVLGTALPTLLSKDPSDFLAHLGTLARGASEPPASATNRGSQDEQSDPALAIDAADAVAMAVSAILGGWDTVSRDLPSEEAVILRRIWAQFPDATSLALARLNSADLYTLSKSLLPPAATLLRDRMDAFANSNDTTHAMMQAAVETLLDQIPLDFDQLSLAVATGADEGTLRAPSTSDRGTEPTAPAPPTASTGVIPASAIDALLDMFAVDRSTLATLDMSLVENTEAATRNAGFQVLIASVVPPAAQVVLGQIWAAWPRKSAGLDVADALGAQGRQPPTPRLNPNAPLNAVGSSHTESPRDWPLWEAVLKEVIEQDTATPTAQIMARILAWIEPDEAERETALRIVSARLALPDPKGDRDLQRAARRTVENMLSPDVSSAPAPTTAPETALWATQAAGLSLLKPHLGLLFSRLGIDAVNKRLPHDDLPRALAVLDALVDTGPGFDPLKKVLLGMAQDTPAPETFALDADTLTLIDGLLRAVIAQWGKLGATAPDGLRETFLHRTGTFEFTDEGVQLRVAPGPFDMLMDAMPWTVTPIKLPWMPFPLHVRWRDADD